MKKINKPQRSLLLQLCVIFFVLAPLKISLIGMCFSAALLCIFTIASNKNIAVVNTFIVFALLITAWRALSLGYEIASISSVCIFLVCLASTLKKLDKGANGIELFNPLVLIVMSVLTGLNLLFYVFSREPLLILFNLGYDQVGHYAITHTLATKVGFLTVSDPNSLMLPRSYLYYPQEWHIINSSFIETSTLKSSLIGFVTLIVVGITFSLILLNGIVTRLSRKLFSSSYKKKNYDNQTPSKIYRFTEAVIHSAMMVTLLMLQTMGYPNFAFSALLFIYIVTTNQNSSLRQELVNLGALMLVVASYSLLLVPATMYIAYYFSRDWQNKDKKVIHLRILSIMAWLVFSFNTLYSSLSNKHLDYIDIGGGSLSYVTVIAQLLLVASSISIYVLKRKEGFKDLLSPFHGLLSLNQITLFSSIGLNVILLLKGVSGGYYLIKFSYFSFFVSGLVIILIVGVISAEKKSRLRKIRVPAIKARIIFPTILLLWTSLPYFPLSIIANLNSKIPFNSPTLPLVAIYKNSQADQIRGKLILHGAEESRKAGLPVAIVGMNSGPDSQWANALSGHWSGYFNDFLEDSIDNEMQFRNDDFRKNQQSKVIFYQDIRDNK